MVYSMRDRDMFECESRWTAFDVFLFGSSSTKLNFHTKILNAISDQQLSSL